MNLTLPRAWGLLHFATPESFAALGFQGEGTSPKGILGDKSFMVNRIALTESILLGALSLLGLVEGIRLIFDKDPMVVYDVLGPGFFVLLVSLGVMITGSFHLIANLRKPQVKKEGAERPLRNRMIQTVLACTLYIVLLDFVGYGLATVVFFLLEFRISGVKNWPLNIFLSSSLTGAFYLIFVSYFDMVFPRGVFFQ